MDRKLENVLRDYFRKESEREAPEHPKKTPHCISLPRFREVLILREQFTSAEETHTSGCEFCQEVIAKFEEEMDSKVIDIAEILESRDTTKVLLTDFIAREHPDSDPGAHEERAAQKPQPEARDFPSLQPHDETGT